MKYSKTIVRKLILGITALSLTTVCLVSTTFAWFAKNANAWTEDFEIDLSINEGLQISVDGKNFYDSIDKEQLKHAIALKKYNLINEEQKSYKDLTNEEIDQYSKVSLSPVSPDDDYNFYGFYSNEYVENDIRNYIENGKYKPVNFTEKKDLKYLNSYVTFDLYFKPIASTNDPKDTYYLQFSKFIDEDDDNIFTDETYIKSTESTVKLSNSLTAKEVELNDNKLTYLDTYKEYVSGDNIIINPENAARLATVLYNEDNTINDEYNNIFEPNIGYSSSAFEISEDDLHDKDKNPMVTYFNNSHNLAKLYMNDELFKKDTINKFCDTNLGVFSKQADGTYNDVKLTLYLWLDGYDGDYLEGVDTNKMHFYLSFTKVGVSI